MDQDCRVIFTPSGQKGQFRSGTSVLEAARKLGVDLDSVCGGRGICGRCQIKQSIGVFPKHGIASEPFALTDENQVEQRYQEKRGTLAEGRRLGCQARLCGDVVINVPPDSQVHRQVVRKEAEARDIEIDPVVRLCLVEVREPDMHDPSSDFRRLQEALAAQWGVQGVRISGPVLRSLQTTLRKGNWQVTAAIRHESEVVALYPGFVEEAYGIAVDIGSTTIAAHLLNLATGAVLHSAGLMNPQIRFGDDLMSRVSYAMMNPGGDVAMTSAVRSALNDLVGEICAAANVARERIVEMTVVGNPIMHHLFLGLDPVELGGAPFALTIDGGHDVPARDVGLEIAPGANVYLLPCIAGHVGADTAGVILSEAPDKAEKLTLLVDVGTNAEIVLGDKHRLLACSSPTGPAFEGAQISSGQRAAAGAIERFRIDPATLEPRYRVIGSPLWSDEAGFEAAIAKSGVTGICGSGIIEAVAEMYLAGIIRHDGVVDGALAARSPRIIAQGRTFSYLIREGEPRITVTQNDIRAIQLAKAALHAGVKLLMDRFVHRPIERIRLAGAFGSHIDVKYAMVLGLVPDCPLEEVSSAGNAAGTGARIALLNRASRGEIERLVQRIEKIETALEPSFQAEFVAAMAFPHDTDPYTALRKVVTLPERVETSASDEGAGGRRRRRG
jgi:uncharacterized 2Fe-2S/4Fe-4S cluster protein (DUF4445 family)